MPNVLKRAGADAARWRWRSLAILFALTIVLTASMAEARPTVTCTVRDGVVAQYELSSVRANDAHTVFWFGGKCVDTDGRLMLVELRMGRQDALQILQRWMTTPFFELCWPKWPGCP